MPQTSFVPHVTLEQYADQYSEHAVLTRKNGVLEMRFHTKGGVAAWSMELHRSLGQLFRLIGSDPENEVLIITGTGHAWLEGGDPDSFAQVESDPETFRQKSYDNWYLDGTRLVENLLFNVDIPTIAAINGPGIHTEFGLVCDLTIAADTAVFMDPHIALGLVPGDGQYLVFQELLGSKRANYLMYINGTGIDAQTALELGVVNEVLPPEKLLERAHELADRVMSVDRITRRLTAGLMRRPWRRRFTQDFQAHFSSELYAAHVSPQYFEGPAHGDSNF